MPFASRVLATLAAALVARVADAHHSFAPHFDIDKPVSISGVVKEFEARNPHSYLHIEAVDENGKTQYSDRPPKNFKGTVTPIETEIEKTTLPPATSQPPAPAVPAQPAAAHKPPAAAPGEDIAAKRRATRYHHARPELVEPVAEILK